MVFPQPVQRYLEKRAVKGPWAIERAPQGVFQAAVVIPALAEGANLFTTLHTLAQNPPEFLEQTLVVVVINQRADAPATDRQQNRDDLTKLAQHELPLSLAWVDATSPGLELPNKQGGVGLARKIGMDLALSRLDWRQKPLLISLDADTLVEANYLESLFAHFRQATSGGAVIPYCHQPADTPAQQDAIDRYELFLRSYVLGLELAGSPYAFATVGSALACTADAYVRCGGMNTRAAAEDFYFLDKLAKTVGVSQLSGTTVHPSPRASHRVPFGTGRSVLQQLNGEDAAPTYYPVAPFHVLRDWLAIIAAHGEQDAAALLARAAAIHPALAEFLTASAWEGIWDKLQRNHSDPARRIEAFHGWFDGLKTLRLIHHLCTHGFPRQAAELALPELFAWAGLSAATGTTASLAVLRQNQQVTKA